MLRVSLIALTLTLAAPAVAETSGECMGCRTPASLPPVPVEPVVMKPLPPITVDPAS